MAIPLEYCRTILCTIHGYIIIACAFLRKSVGTINRWCIQLAKITFMHQPPNIHFYIAIIRYLKMLGYYEPVSKLCASLKLSERLLIDTTSVVYGNGWNIMQAIMHIDIDDWYFHDKMKHNEQYFRYLLMTDRCDNAIQRVFHGTLIVCKYIADLYRKKRCMDLALIWYEMIISNVENEFVPMYYSFIAEGFNESNEKQRALEYYAKAVDHWRQIQCREYKVSFFPKLSKFRYNFVSTNRVIDEVRRLPQYPWSCYIAYDVRSDNKIDDIVDYHQNVDSANYLLRNQRQWLSILGPEYCAHASRIYVDIKNFKMAFQWCQNVFEWWPKRYRYCLIKPKLDIIKSLSSENAILLIQQCYSNRSQRLKH